MQLNVVNKDVWLQLRCCTPVFFFGGSYQSYNYIHHKNPQDIFYSFQGRGSYRVRAISVGLRDFQQLDFGHSSEIWQGRLRLARCNLPRALATLCWPTPQELNPLHTWVHDVAAPPIFVSSCLLSGSWWGQLLTTKTWDQCKRNSMDP